MTKLFKAAIIILVIPAIIYIINVFQDYAESEMSLNAFEELFMGVLPFLIVGLFSLGVFLAIRRIGGGKSGGEE